MESAGDTQTGVPITRIIIRDVVFDGSPAGGVMLVTDLSSNVTFSQGELTCTVPCFFAEEPGFYQFRVGAGGYLFTVHELSADYKISGNGCPSIREGPVKLNFGLRPE